jgi:hypothetical protein
MIIRELPMEDEGGLSYHQMSKVLTTKYKIKGLASSHVRYHMETLRKKGLVMKEGSKYYLESPIVSVDGIILFANPPAVINCPYFDTCDTDGNCFRVGCKFFEDLPEVFQTYYRKVLE